MIPTLAKLAMLEKAFHLLTDDSILALITPNVTYVQSDSQLTMFRLDLEHMQYFSTSAITAVALKLGFQVLHLESLDFPNMATVNPSPIRNNLKRAVKGLIKKLPGFQLAAKISDRRKSQALRKGNYHLFCIL